jgi:hypothetical protein
MQTTRLARFALLMLAVAGSTAAFAAQAAAQAAAAPYPAMAPLSQYLMAEDAEIALARSAAPKSIADAATVMVLRREGYAVTQQGTNGFLCIVERAWANPTTDPQFWNPKMRAPNCFNAAATASFVQIYLTKTRLVLHGKSLPEILRVTTEQLDSGVLPALQPGAMCYMMSPQQYLNDTDKRWHPHLMFFAAGNVAPSWGANEPGSPLVAGDDPQERVTIFMMVAKRWSDGTPDVPASH